MTYKLHRSGKGVIHPDGYSIPEDPTSGAWQDYLAWLGQGNTPLPADADPPPASDKQAASGAKAWFKANPGAAQLFEMSISELEAEVRDLVDALFPSATEAQRRKKKLLLMTLAVCVRIFAKRLGMTD